VPGEKITEGLDNLRNAAANTSSSAPSLPNARRDRHRRDMPSSTCIAANAHALARYAAICLEAGWCHCRTRSADGRDHSIERCEEVTEWTLNAVYEACI